MAIEFDSTPGPIAADNDLIDLMASGVNRAKAFSGDDTVIGNDADNAVLGMN